MDWDDILINFELVKEKKSWTGIEEKWDDYLSKMDEGTITYEELMDLKETIQGRLRLGNKAKNLLEMHLKNPKIVDAESLVKELLTEYQQWEGK